MKPFSATRKQLSILSTQEEDFEEGGTEAKEEEEEKSLKEAMMDRFGTKLVSSLSQLFLPTQSLLSPVV
jgi:hypothetical protein